MNNSAATRQPAVLRKLDPGLHHLAFLLNYIIGHRPADLSLSEVRDAADQGNLLSLLAFRYRHLADFYYLIHKPSALDQTEAALSDAARLLKWRERLRIGVSESGLCLALAIVIEALQSQFLQPLLHPEPGSRSSAFHPPAN